MSVNVSKSNINHFRSNASNISEFVSTCGSLTIEYSSQYMYFRVMSSEHLDFSLTAKVVAQSAGRALALLIARCKNAGGLPFLQYLYCTSYNIWGSHYFSCRNSIHHRAMMFFLGTGKYTPDTSIYGEMSRNSFSVEQKKSVCNHWH